MHARSLGKGLDELPEVVAGHLSFLCGEEVVFGAIYAPVIYVVLN